MPLGLKELIVVLALGGMVFALGKPVALKFMAEGDLRLRRNAWLILTIAAFLSPSFWTFVLIAAPTLYIAGRRDSNPLALYLLLMGVIPPVAVEIPAIAVNRIFELDIFRLLSICVLIPAAFRLRKSADADPLRGFTILDLLLLGYGVLQIVLFVPPDLPNHVILENSFTNGLRTAFLFVVDFYALYYVASRSPFTRDRLVEGLAAYCLCCTIMASVAIFESLKHWLLYVELYSRWGGSLMETEYIFRNHLLRAVSSTGNALSLGYMLAVAFGFWLYLQSRMPRSWRTVMVTIVLLLGMLASMSRGPWLGAVAIYFAYAALGPRFRLMRAAILFSTVLGVVLLSPIGKQLTSTLPFMGGHVEESTLTYREKLAARAWQLLQARPLLGDQLAFSKMEDLRQGQGIIDVVNTYLDVALFRGFLGLSLFLGFILVALARARRAARAFGETSLDSARLGANIAACILGTLLMLADCSFIQGYAQMYYVLGGVAAAYFSLWAAQDSRIRAERASQSDSVELT